MSIDYKLNIKSLIINNQFNNHYLRNHRSSGQKSLRCFPSCRLNGHINSGFCGESIKSTLLIDIDSDNNDTKIDGMLHYDFNSQVNGLIDKRINKQVNKLIDSKLTNQIDDIINGLVFLLEIRPIKSFHAIDKYKLSTDDSNSYSQLVIESGLIDGEIVNVTTNHPNINIDIEFNNKLHSYDYSWKSNRWSNDEKHVVTIYMFSVNSLNQLIQIVDSSSFTVASSHKSPKIATAERLINLSNTITNDKKKRKIVRNNKSITKSQSNEVESDLTSQSSEDFIDININSNINFNRLVDYSCYQYDIQRQLMRANIINEYRQLVDSTTTSNDSAII